MLQLRTRSSSPFENWSCFRQFNSVWRVFHAITKLFPLGKIENCTNRRFERSMLLKFDNFKKDCRFLTQIYKWKPYMVLSKHFSKKFLGLFDKTRIKSLNFLQSKQFTSPKTSNKLIKNTKFPSKFQSKSIFQANRSYFTNSKNFSVDSIISNKPHYSYIPHPLNNIIRKVKINLMVI